MIKFLHARHVIVLMAIFAFHVGCGDQGAKRLHGNGEEHERGPTTRADLGPEAEKYLSLVPAPSLEVHADFSIRPDAELTYARAWRPSDFRLVRLGQETRGVIVFDRSIQASFAVFQVDSSNSPCALEDTEQDLVFDQPQALLMFHSSDDELEYPFTSWEEFLEAYHSDEIESLPPSDFLTELSGTYVVRVVGDDYVEVVLGHSPVRGDLVMPRVVVDDLIASLEARVRVLENRVERSEGAGDDAKLQEARLSLASLRQSVERGRHIVALSGDGLVIGRRSDGPLIDIELP